MSYKTEPVWLTALKLLTTTYINDWFIDQKHSHSRTSSKKNGKNDYETENCYQNTLKEQVTKAIKVGSCAQDKSLSKLIGQLAWDQKHPSSSILTGKSKHLAKEMLLKEKRSR